ncbi:chemotaxis protein [Novosphingobium sp. G106]|uniref:methyl-accepting chemotaxis protein n=1 Tax=Novosphingobium sp. G106 TaxID=2849500 RepID=UPI001C2D2A8D|nr:methyl-accepting chemotaxis protein [Novosphingobium sp. G106]MBV1692364.1 chemotaxis protein [Novosphingobium sp. G106]
MRNDILSLALDLSKHTAEKISSIDMIMVKTQMLSMNARLEAARAGEVGKSFAVVAQEMTEVTKEVSALSAGLRSAINDNTGRIEAAGRQMLLDASGNRFADMAHNAVEIIDRNLYERSCDVRWWATDGAVVAAAQDASAEALAYATQRLATILRSYTVYLDLWIADANGRIIANGRPDRYATVVGRNASSAEWFRRGMTTRSGDDFVVCDIMRNDALGNAEVATYATAIRAGGSEHGRPLGVLGIFFDWEPQAAAIVNGVPLGADEQKTTRVMLLNAKNRIIASSTGFAEGEVYPLQASGKRGYYQTGPKLISYALTPGYETYEGLGWFGCIETQAATSGH